MLLNTIQTSILDNLATYGYLSAIQMQRLTQYSLSYIREQLSVLRERKLVASYHVEITKKIRAENIYYLLPDGAAIVSSKEFSGMLRMPLSTSVSILRDYSHRKSFIDFFISTVQYMDREGIELDPFLTYYDKVGNQRRDRNLKAQTELIVEGQKIIPDGIMVTSYEKVDKLYLIEMFCDTTNSTQRVIQSISALAKVIQSGAASDKMFLQVDAVVLCVFLHSSTMQAVIKRLRQNQKFSTLLSRYYFFATLDLVMGDYENAFTDIHGNTLAF